MLCSGSLVAEWTVVPAMSLLNPLWNICLCGEMWSVFTLAHRLLSLHLLQLAHQTLGVFQQLTKVSRLDRLEGVLPLCVVAMVMLVTASPSVM